MGARARVGEQKAKRSTPSKLRRQRRLRMPRAGQGLAWPPATLGEAARGNTIETVHEVLGTLAGRYRADEVLTAVKHIPARTAQFRPMPAWVRPELTAAYRAKGIENLYSHQAC